MIHCRIILLHHFIDVASRETTFPYPERFAHYLPQLWLDFQTASFTGEPDLPDPFESLFQISCLIPTTNEWLQTAELHLHDILRSPLLYCLDEAQSDLDCFIPSRVATVRRTCLSSICGSIVFPKGGWNIPDRSLSSPEPRSKSEKPLKQSSIRIAYRNPSKQHWLGMHFYFQTFRWSRAKISFTR